MNWRRIKEQGELYPTYFPRTRESIDKEIVTEREYVLTPEGKYEMDRNECIYKNPLFRHELYLACRDMLFEEEAKKLTNELKGMYPEKPKERLRQVVTTWLREQAYPKEWRIKKRMTEERKKLREERGY